MVRNILCGSFRAYVALILFLLPCCVLYCIHDQPPIFLGEEAGSGARAVLMRLFYGHRSVLARLSGLPEYMPLSRSPVVDRSQLRTLRGLISRSDSTLDRAALELFLGKSESGLDLLSHIEDTEERGAAFYIDLSAAYLATADSQGIPLFYVMALSAAESALKKDAFSREAFFNRALALEKLRLDRSAMRAWEYYIALGDEHGWLNEAREHLGHLREGIDRRLISEHAIHEAIAALDKKRIDHLVTVDPLLVRTYLEDKLIFEWARHTRRGEDKAAFILSAFSFAADRFAFYYQDSLLKKTAITLRNCSSNSHQREAILSGLESFEGALKFYDMQQYGKAALAFKRASEYLRPAGVSYWVWAELYISICEYYASDFQGALGRLRRLDVVASRNGYVSASGRIHWMVGLICYEQSDIKKALENYGKSLSAYHQNKELENQAALENLIASALAYIGDFRQSWLYRYEALRKRISIRAPRRLQNIFDLSGETAQQLGAPDAALYFYDEAVDQARLPLERAVAYWRRSRVYDELGMRESALSDLERAGNWSRRISEFDLRKGVEADIAFARGVINKDLKPYEAIVSLSEALKVYEETDYNFRIPLVLRARSQAYRVIGNYRQSEIDLDESICRYEEFRLATASSLQAARYFGQSRSLFDDMISIQLEYRKSPKNALIYAIRSRGQLPSTDVDCRRSTGLSAGDRFLTNLQGRISRDEGIIVYTLTRGGLLVWFLRREKIDFHIIRISQEQLKRFTARRMRSIIGASDLAHSLKPLKDLYDLLLLPLEDKLPELRRLIIIPDRYLRDIPFPALYDAQRNKFLIEKYSVLMNPNLDYLQQKQSNDGERRLIKKNLQALFVANPSFDRTRFSDLPSLAGSGLEARTLSSIINTKSTVLSGGGATRMAVLGALERNSIFHYTGHAASSAEYPERSALLVAPDPPNDKFGLLTIDDIQRAHIDKLSLVVLAACHTGDRSLDEASSFFGFTSVFISRGVRDVVTTLWPVDDAVTAIMMIAFYRRLTEGEDPPAALRDVQIKCIRKGLSPRYWAPFTVAGFS